LNFCEIVKALRLEPKLFQITSPAFLGLLVTCLLAGTASADEIFPQPPELQPDIQFWLSIFSRYSTDEGVLHDSRNLGVIYDRLDIPSDLSRRDRSRQIDKRRKEVRAVLQTLASGKRDGLSAEERRVLALWPADVSDETLAAAASRIRYQQGLKDRFRRGLERAGRWRSFINEEFAAQGVPIELAALAHVESSYNPNARSHVGASGIWQFTRSTGRRFMRVDHVVDERNDPFIASRGAARLLAYNYSITGSWPMAITAYNHGLASVRRAMRRFGDDALVDILRNYDGRAFGFASRNFYVAFLAAMEIDQNPEKYFPGVMPESPTEYTTVVLPAYISVQDLSEAIGVSKSLIATHNPGLQATVWEGSKHLPKAYELRLPATAIDSPLAGLIANLPDDMLVQEQLPDLFHRVVRGDTLSEIAQTYDTRVSTLVALNQLGSSHRIRAGQRLRLPAAGPAPASAAPPVTAEVASAVVSPTAEEPEIPAEVAGPILGPVQTALLSDPSDYSVAEDNTIEVHPLETLGHFGDWLEIKTQRLRDLNGLAFRTPVEVGQRIRLDLGTIDAATFEARRIAYHRAQQDSFFRQHVIKDKTEHTIRQGESIWVVALRRYDVPLWLLRQYNPGLDLHNVRPGTRLQIPILVDAPDNG
jgi:membrane-bound lytic murein transglycosylase D